MKRKIIAFTMAVSIFSMLVAGCGKSDKEAASENQQVEVEEQQTVDSEMDYGLRMDEMNMADYVVLGEYMALNADVNVKEPTQEDIQNQIDEDLEGIAQTEELTEGEVQQGDTVNIDYVGKKDDVAFDGGTAQGYDLTIGSHSFIDGFEDGLIGAEVGQTVDLNLTFPEQYHSEELAGAEVVFTVTVNSIQRKHVPELTDDIVSQLDGTCSTVDELKVAVRDYLYTVNKEDAENEAKSQLLEEVAANAQVKEVPSKLVDERVDYMTANAARYAASYNMTYEDFVINAMQMTVEDFETRIREESEKDIEKYMVAYAIAQQEGLIITPEDAKESLEPYVQYMGFNSYEEMMLTAEGRSMLEGEQLTKVVDYLFENAIVNETVVTE